jgi:DNA modification methylase
VDRIARSIKEYGFNQPIVCDKEGVIIVGHARLEAAKQLGLKTVPVLTATITEQQAREYRILDNKLSDQAEYDFEALNIELEELQIEGFNLEGWGLELLPTDEEIDTTEPDDAEVDDASLYIKDGDVVTLEAHTVTCGDCAELELPKCDILLTDPPYGVGRDKGGVGHNIGECPSLIKAHASKYKAKKYNDSWDDKIPERELFDTLLSKSKLAIIFGGNFFAHLLPQSTHWIFWDKLTYLPSIGDGEIAWTNSKRASVSKITIQQTNYVGEKDRKHPTQKPLKLWAEILKLYGKDSKTVLDPFSGSGTTLIACDRMGMVAHCIEREPKYVQATIERYRKECEKADRPFTCKINGEDVTAEMLNAA